MPSDDEDQSSDNELDNICEYFPNIPGITVAQEQQHDVPPQENSNSEGSDNNPPRFFSVSPPSSGSSSSLEVISPLEALFSEVAHITRQAADILSSEFNFPEPGLLLDRILEISSFRSVPGPQSSIPSPSLFPSPSSIPSRWANNILSDDHHFFRMTDCPNAMPQVQRTQPVPTIAAFCIIILMILNRHQYPYNLLNFPH